MGHTVLVSWKTKNIEKKSVWGSSKIRMMKYRKSINRKASWPAVNIACAPGSMKDHWCLSPKQFLDFRGLIFHWVTAVSCRVAASVDVCPKFFSHDFPVKFAFIALLFFFSLTSVHSFVRLCVGIWTVNTVDYLEMCSLVSANRAKVFLFQFGNPSDKCHIHRELKFISWAK